MNNTNIKWLIIAIIGSALIMVPAGFNRTIIKSSSTKYNNIYELVDNLGFKPNIPDRVKNFNGEILKSEISSTGVAEIDSAEFVFKAAPYVSFNVSVLGLYDDCSDDNKYLYNESDFIRIRRGYKGYEHCTIIDWGDYNSMQGIIIPEVLSNEEVFREWKINNPLSISTQDILILENNSNDSMSISNNDIEYKYIDLRDRHKLALPIFESKIEVLNDIGKDRILIDNKQVFVIVYNGTQDDEDNLHGNVDINDNVTLQYSKENVFKKGSNDYNTYNRLVNDFSYVINNINKNIINY